MKLILLYTKSIAFYFFLPIITLASWYVQHETGPHGGVLKKSEGYYIEVKKADKFLNVYVLDPKLKAVTDKTISGEVKFFLPDNTILPVTLKAFAEDNFVAEMPAEFTKCQVSLMINKVSVSVMLEKQHFVLTK